MISSDTKKTQCCENCINEGRRGEWTGCTDLTCPCHSAPTDPTGWRERFESALKSFDFEGIARAFAESDIKWHAKEWKEFIELVRTQDRAELAEKVKALRDVYDEDVDQRNDKYRIEGRNEVLLEILTLLEEDGTKEI